LVVGDVAVCRGNHSPEDGFWVAAPDVHGRFRNASRVFGTHCCNDDWSEPMNKMKTLPALLAATTLAAVAAPTAATAQWLAGDDIAAPCNCPASTYAYAPAYGYAASAYEEPGYAAPAYGYAAPACAGPGYAALAYGYAAP